MDVYGDGIDNDSQSEDSSADISGQHSPPQEYPLPSVHTPLLSGDEALEGMGFGTGKHYILRHSGLYSVSTQL